MMSMRLLFHRFFLLSLTIHIKREPIDKRAFRRSAVARRRLHASSQPAEIELLDVRFDQIRKKQMRE